MKKYPKIYPLGHEENRGILNEVIVCESKVDGANFRCQYLPNEDRLEFGSRRYILDQNTDPNEWIAIRAYKKAFEEYHDNFIPNVVYFSESMQQHTIKYENIPDTIGYDVYDLKRGEFYDWKAAKEAFESIGIPFIHVHFEKRADKVTTDDLMELIKQSPYRKEGDEGVVLKCYKKLNAFGRPLFAKYVDPIFKEENKKVFQQKTERVSIAETNIVDEYLVPARFNKAVLHFKDEGYKIEMKLVPQIYQYLYDDILSENILDISRRYDSIDFGILKKLIASQTAKYLKEYIVSQIMHKL